MDNYGSDGGYGLALVIFCVLVVSYLKWFSESIEPRQIEYATVACMPHGGIKYIEATASANHVVATCNGDGATINVYLEKIKR